jgi:3-dehydroquinate synthase
VSDVETLTVVLGDRSYPIHFGSDLSAAFGKAATQAREIGRKIAIVTDENVLAANPLFKGPLKGLPTISVAPGEGSKSLMQFGRVCEFLAGEKIDRGGLLIAVGGGVVGDLGGFAAAAYLRGIDFWQVPTTLLAMVDSAVGGKTGVNLYAGKNLVGAFHQPRAVFCDTGSLKTLPPREFGAGMAEVIKTGMLADPELFAKLESGEKMTTTDERLPGIVRRCCEIKAEVVRADERETAEIDGRALLNLGHTFAHAIEAVAGYGEYLHGEAVGVGLIAASRLSEKMKLIDDTAVSRVRALVEANGLPVRLREPLSREALVEAMRRDKKVKHGHLRFVVMESIGRAATRDDIELSQAVGIWSELGAT